MRAGLCGLWHLGFLCLATSEGLRCGVGDRVGDRVAALQGLGSSPRVVNEVVLGVGVGFPRPAPHSQCPT